MLSKADLPFLSGLADGGGGGSAKQQQHPQATAATRELVHAAIGAGAAQICRLLEERAMGGPAVSD